MQAFLSSVIAALAALLGGYVALRNRRRLNLALGLTAGIILGLIAFDLLPEIFRITALTGLDTAWPMIALVSGFLLFHILEKMVLVHHPHETQYGPHVHPHVGLASALGLCGHSFLDGVAIGVAFQVNHSVGIAVALAVIAHRFADGFSTTNVMLLNRSKISSAQLMLYIAAAMPILGALAAQIFSFSENTLAVYLGFFAGFLLYIGAADILPQAHSKGPSRSAIWLTVIGVVFMFIVTRFA
ncbi:MAG TPA: ZIP family metal transporter [Candidatus Saccharimonadales bacterium]|nr:ZIP family metal transporter [Candidatus Saccharimonadales bacterium]